MIRSVSCLETVADVGESAMPVGAGAVTVTGAEAVAEPATAVMVVTPGRRAWTSPFETLAIAGAEVCQVMACPAIVAPFWSLTVAASCPDCPVIKVRADWLSVMEVATGVCGPVPESEVPHPAIKIAAGTHKLTRRWIASGRLRRSISILLRALVDNGVSANVPIPPRSGQPALTRVG